MTAEAPPEGAALFEAKARQTNLSSFHLLRRALKQADGLYATARNSGTHWLRDMMSHAMAHQFGTPPPPYATGDRAFDYLRPAKYPVVHPDIPQIIFLHSIPSGLITSGWLKPWSPRTPVTLLVRNIPDAVRSNYVKWRDQYDPGLSAFVRGGDPKAPSFVSDPWWYVLFFNRWGDFAERNPGQVLVVRYEDLKADSASWLKRIARHWGFELSDEAVAAGLAVSPRDSISKRQDPQLWPPIVRSESDVTRVAFSAEDVAVMEAIFARHLRHDFGYGYPINARRS